MVNILLFLTLGLCAGIFSGLIGIGGGVIIVPALIFLFGFSQHQAQGTTLALLVPPIGILAAYTYYKSGYVDFKVATLICLGFLLGGLIGSKLAINLDENHLRKVFGMVITLMGVYFTFKK
ncbi:permease [Candidatus Peregrinibacteria bacterium RIFOXYA12_FULL_33_12]|nr:MAG: permease [Candidatus Peregrinibacteria bacterium RIFOXYA12_FULL_33_12]